MMPSELPQWLATARGQYLLAWEQRCVDQVVTDIFGFNAVQVGLCEQDFLRANRMPHRIHCSVGCEQQPGRGGVYMFPEELPFASQSLDLIVLPHALEFASHPHQVLREAERVLVPEGNLVIAGFNPLSMWGFRRWVAGNLGEMPWMGQYLSISRLKDWLSLLGFETRFSSFGCYAPPVSSEIWLRRWSFLDSMGKHWWPIVGGTYLLQAVKRVQGMRLITPKWREQKARKKAMVPVTQKSGDE
jgi:SAM-dependent methyltransferase